MSRTLPVLLTDEQMRKFITDGYLILNTDFSDAFHQGLMEQLNYVYTHEGNPGNNLLPRIPDVQKVFDHPTVRGALTSVLGPDYMLHAHRHGHYNAADKAGGWHKDSYWGYRRIRNHHPWWAMIMYFPQHTPVELGPTGIMPGTQNYETRTFLTDDHQEEAVASGQAGTFALIHYDIWHRSTANLLGKERYMLKFEFMRTTAPVSPSWDSQETEWRKPANMSLPIAHHDVLWEETWNWLSGRIGSIANTQAADVVLIHELEQGIDNEHEPIAINAAYELARLGDQGIDALLRMLHHDSTRVSLRAAYGLSVSGAGAVLGLMHALQADRDITVKHAVFALGELRHLAAGAVPALNQLLNHSSEVVRQTVVEALSMIAAPAEAVVAGLIQCLQDEDVQVRFMAGLSIARLGAVAEDAVEQLEMALEDENRYVRAHAVEALHYIGTDRAKDVLIDYLLSSRWCPTTTAENAFYP